MKDFKWHFISAVLLGVVIGLEIAILISGTKGG